jgi:hypothetical protein
MAFVINATPKGVAPREKISLIKTETANATTAELPENARKQGTAAAQKERVAGAYVEKARGKATAADKEIRARKAVPAREIRLLPSLKNSNHTAMKRLSQN